jgi:hypothetical protein
MGSTRTAIDSDLRSFIEAQRLFFVATAPLAVSGHVNLSPKGLDTLRILDDRTVAYLDYVGSGAETIAHLRENGRIVVMFCAFSGPPKIVRLHGRGEVLEPQHAEFATLRGLFPPEPVGRAVIRIHAERISVSCGFGVPMYEFVAERDQLPRWCERKGEEAVRRYQIEKNASSLDGLPTLHWVESAANER